MKEDKFNEIFSSIFFAANTMYLESKDYVCLSCIMGNEKDDTTTEVKVIIEKDGTKRFFYEGVEVKKERQEVGFIGDYKGEGAAYFNGVSKESKELINRTYTYKNK